MPAGAHLDRALLVLHSPKDAVVDVDNARRIFEAAKHPKSFVSLDGADHLLTRPEDAEYAAEVIAGWSARYLPMREPAAATAAPPAGEVVVEETGGGRFEQRVTTSEGGALLADEPVRVGGAGAGPTPYDLLLAALGACTSMTLRLYAERKGLPLDRVHVRLSHTRDHRADCEPGADCPPLEAIRREITLDGALDGEQRARLLEIADKCPVHRTLEHGVKVITSAAAAPARRPA